MKAKTLKTERSYDSTNNRSYKIQTYGKYNDYPQRVMEIVSASITGSSCLDTYFKFIVGRGFAQSDFCKAVVNSQGTTVDALLQEVARDLATFNGFALHVNYNANFAITSVSHVPFEQIRFEEMNDNGKFNRLCTHPDWGKRATALRRFDIKDRIWFTFFNPDPEVIMKEVEEAGGWLGYKGQILYYSASGPNVYPCPIFEAALTDMSNEEGLSNITHRNVRHNFLPAGMVIDHDQTINSEEQKNEVEKELMEFQGDTNAGQLMYVNIKGEQKPPEFVPFAAGNFDKDFEKAEAKTPDIIGRSFKQPPILRGVDVGGNFGADLMMNAYDFYNSITETERIVISEQFTKVFSLWHEPNINPDGDYSILAKVYRVNVTLAEKLGANLANVLELLKDGTMQEKAKKSILMKIYGLEEDDVNVLLEDMR